MDEKNVFVKVEEYEKILGKLNLLNKHLTKAKEQLAVIKDLKKDEDRELVDWESEVHTMENKINFITSKISKEK